MQHAKFGKYKRIFYEKAFTFAAYGNWRSSLDEE
jgi:hypothetical protein